MGRKFEAYERTGRPEVNSCKIFMGELVIRRYEALHEGNHCLRIYSEDHFVAECIITDAEYTQLGRFESMKLSSDKRPSDPLTKLVRTGSSTYYAEYGPIQRLWQAARLIELAERPQ